MRKAIIKKPYIHYNYNQLETRKNKTDLIVIHHTGNNTDDDLGVQDINKIHQNQGYTCIGYHYVIRKDGSIEAGRPHWTIGAHAYGENRHTIGIHLSGNFNIAKPTKYQIESLALLIANICSDYSIPIDRKHIKGHRELMATACPGENLYKILDTIVGKAIFYKLN